MNNPVLSTTRFVSSCINLVHLVFFWSLAGLYVLASAVLPMLLLVGLLLLVGPADAQSVQAMVKQQPFPYRTGVAMDSALYANVKAKLLAAEQLRKTSEQAIRDLQAEIGLTRKAMDDQMALGRHDKAQADRLAGEMNRLQGELNVAKSSLSQAEQAIGNVLVALPRRVRKTLRNATSEQIAAATLDYLHTLQKRKWTWSGAGVLAGLIGGLCLLL